MKYTTFEIVFSITIISIFIFSIGFICGDIYCSRRTKAYTENNILIDSLTTANDSIKIKVEKLDSIKNAKVIEVNSLDNDSTLKLFYKLVSE